MSYTTPPTFVADDPLAAADLNILGDDIAYLKGVADGVVASCVQLNRSTNQSISDSTDTKITWTIERFDFGGWWSSGPDIVVPASAVPAGFTTIIIDIDARLKFASSTAGNRRVIVKLNGVSFGQRTVAGLGGGDATDVSIPESVECEAGDVITVEAWQSSGGSLNVTEANVTVKRYAPAS